MKFKENRCLFALILVFTLLYCTGPQKETIDLDQVRKAINEYEAAFKESDWDKMAEMYAVDAIRLRHNSPAVKGRQAIKERLEYYNYKNFEFLRDEESLLAGSGDIPYEISSNHKVRLINRFGKLLVGESKYMRVWKKQDDGVWKLQADMWSPNQAQE